MNDNEPQKAKCSDFSSLEPYLRNTLAVAGIFNLIIIIAFKGFIINIPLYYFIKVNDGRKNIYSSSITYLNVFINSPPDTGQCIIQVKDSNGTWDQANSGRALLDVFKIVCSGWKDPNYHAIVKYVFKRKDF